MQILTDKERKSIRADIYSASDEEQIDFKDKKILFFLRHCKDKNVLDLGCVDHNASNWKSRYWLHKAIRSCASNTVGLDYYEDGVAQLQKIGFNVVFGDAQSFSFDERFDVVTAGDLIEHLPNLAGFFTSVYNVLDENGKFVITTPNPWCWKYMLYHIFFGKLKPVNREHVSWFCLQTLDNLSQRFGLKVVEHEYSSRRVYERLIPLPSRLKHTTLGVVFQKS